MLNFEKSPYLQEGVVPLLTSEEEDLSQIPDPNLSGKMTGEVLPDDWTPEHGN